MYCESHRLETREICMEKLCQKPWAVCSRCAQHQNHRTMLCSDFYRSVSQLVREQNLFETSLKGELLELINYEVTRTLGLVKSLIEESMCEDLRNRVRTKQFGCRPDIQLAVREYEKDGKFREKYRERLMGMQFNIEFERAIQAQMKETQTHKIQSCFFNLQHSLKQAVNNSTLSGKPHSKQETKEGFYKTRSFSNTSNSTFSGSASFQNKRKRSVVAKPSIFKDVPAKQKVKKVVMNKIKFVEEPMKEVNRSQELLRIMENKIANRIMNSKIHQGQEPLIKESDYMVQKQQGSMLKPPSIQEIKEIKEQIREIREIKEIKQAVREEIRWERQQEVRYQERYQERPPETHNTQPKPKAREITCSKQSSREQSIIANKQNIRLQRSSVKSMESSRMESRIESRGRGSNVNKSTKIQKRVSIVENKAEESCELIIQLEEKKSFNNRTIQELEARLKIVPEVNGFLSHNLSEIQEIWESPNNVCWKMYFEIKEQLQIKQSKYQDEEKALRGIKYSKVQIIQQLEHNIKNTKIKTISKLRNHLILQYLVKYSAQLLILFEGVNVENTGFSAEKYLTTLQNLAEGDVKGAFAYMTTNLNKLKLLI